MHCSICLESFRDPVVTPCGHLFCIDCLRAASATSPDATKAPCPSCRRDINLVNPDKTLIPEKYHQFIDSGIRKIYLDSSIEDELNAKIALLENKASLLEEHNTELMKFCISYGRELRESVELEMKTRKKYEQLKKELRQANIAMAELVAKETKRINNLRSIHQKFVAYDSLVQVDPSDSPPVQKRARVIDQVIINGHPVTPISKRVRITRTPQSS